MEARKGTEENKESLDRKDYNRPGQWGERLKRRNDEGQEETRRLVQEMMLNTRGSSTNWRGAYVEIHTLGVLVPCHHKNNGPKRCPTPNKRAVRS